MLFLDMGNNTGYRIVTNIAEQDDAVISSPSDGQILTYDDASGKWINADASGGAIPIDTGADFYVSKDHDAAESEAAGVTSIYLGPEYVMDSGTHYVAIDSNGNVGSLGNILYNLVYVATKNSANTFTAAQTIGAGGNLTFNSGNSLGAYRSEQAVFVGVNTDGTDNVVTRSGYNSSGNGGRIDTSKAAAGLAVEARFVVGGVAGTELHLYDITTSGVEYRPFSFWAAHTTDDILTSMRFSQLTMTGKGGNTFEQWQTSAGVATCYWSTGTKLNCATNNVAYFAQRNAADSAYLNLPYINNSNAIKFGGGAYWVGGIPTTGELANTFAWMQATTFTTNQVGLKIDCGTITDPLSLGYKDFRPVSVSGAGERMELYWFNSQNTGSAHSQITLLTAGSSAGDSQVVFSVNGSTTWYCGLDNSDSDKIKLGTSPLGSADKITIDTVGNIVPGMAALATNATAGFTYIQTCAGTPTGVPTAYTGRVPIVFDSTNLKLYVYTGGAWKATAALT